MVITVSKTAALIPTAPDLDAVADAFTIDENRTATVTGNLLTGMGLTAGVTGTLGADTGGEGDRTLRSISWGDDPDENPTTATAGGVDVVAGTTQNLRGTINIKSNGDFVFTPTNYFNNLAEGGMGTLVFSYWLDDSATPTANSDFARLTITINGVNDAPVQAASLPTADPATLGESYSLDLTQYFTDPDMGDAVTSFSLDGTCTGFAVMGTNLVGSESGSLPSSGLTLPTTTCMVKGNDGDADSEPVSIAIALRATNQPTQEPEPVDDTVSLTEMAAVAILGDTNGGITGNARTGGSVTVVPSASSAMVTGGLMEDNANSNTTVVVTQYEAGTVTAFTSAAEDAGSGSTQGTAVSATDEGVSASFSMAADGSFVFDITSNADSVNALVMGTDADFVFTYELDGESTVGVAAAQLGTITFTVTGENDAPTVALTADDDPYTFTEGGGDMALTAGTTGTGPLGNDSGSGTLTITHYIIADSFPTDGGALDTAATGVSPASTGSPSPILEDGTDWLYFVLSTDGRLYLADGAASESTYDIDRLQAGQTVTEHISYRLHNGTDEDSATITITITGANDAPKVEGSKTDHSVAEGSTLAFAAADFGFTDIDNATDALTSGSGFATADALASISIESLPDAADGVLSVSGTDITSVPHTVPVADLAGNLVFTPASGSGAGNGGSFMFKVSDGTASSAAASMPIAITASQNTAPLITITDFPAAGEFDDDDQLEFTLTRTGSTADPLTVGFRISVNSSEVSTTTARFAATSPTVMRTIHPTILGDVDADDVVTLTLFPSDHADLTNAGVGDYRVPTDGTQIRSVTVVAATSTTPTASLHIGTAGTQMSTITEAAGSSRTATVTVMLSEAAGTGGVTVNLERSGSATLGTGNDYTQTGLTAGTAPAFTIAIDEGSDSATFTLTALDDSAEDASETIIFTVVTGTGYLLATSGAEAVTVTITDDDTTANTAPTANPDTYHITADASGFGATDLTGGYKAITIASQTYLGDVINGVTGNEGGADTDAEQGASGLTVTHAAPANGRYNGADVAGWNGFPSIDGAIVEDGHAAPGDSYNSTPRAGVGPSFSLRDDYGVVQMLANGDFRFIMPPAASSAYTAMPAYDSGSANSYFDYPVLYRVSDGQSPALTNDSTLTLQIRGVNDAPVAADPLPGANDAVLGQSYSMPLAQFFTDPDTGDSVTSFSLSGSCTGFVVSGTNLVGSESGSLPSSGVSTSTTCMVIGNDGDANSAPVAIAINVLTTSVTPLMAADDSFTIDENRTATVTGNLLTGMDLSNGVTGTLAADTGGVTSRAISQAEVVASATAVFTNSAAAPDNSAAQYPFGTDADGNSRGSLQMSTAGAFIFTPGPAYHSLDDASDTAQLFLRYRIQDRASPTPSTNDAVLTITITGANDAPTAVPVTHLRVLNTSTQTLTAAHFNFMDADADGALAHVAITGEPLELVSGAVTTTSAGTLAINGDEIMLTQSLTSQNVNKAALDMNHLVFTSSDSFTGTARITFRVNDGTVDSTATYNLDIRVIDSTSINAMTDRPATAIGEDASATSSGNVLTDTTDGHVADTGTGLMVSRYSADDTDITMAPETPGNDVDGTYGTLAITATGDWTYTPHNTTGNAADALDQGDMAMDTFIYEITDGTDTATAQLIFTISGANDRPTLAFPDTTACAPQGLAGSSVPFTEILYEQGRDRDRHSLSRATKMCQMVYTDPDEDDTTLSKAGTGGGKFGVNPGAAQAGDGGNDQTAYYADDALNGGKGRCVVDTYGEICIKENGSWTYTLDESCDSERTTANDETNEAGYDPGCSTIALHNGSTVDTFFTFTVDDQGDGETVGTNRHSNNPWRPIRIIGASDHPTTTPVRQSVARNDILDFEADDFGFADVDAGAAGMFGGVRIIAIPDTAQGVLKLNNVDVTNNQEIPASDLGLLTFEPSASLTPGTVGGAAEASFLYRVYDQDTGGAGAGTDSCGNTYQVKLFSLPCTGTSFNIDVLADQATFTVTITGAPASITEGGASGAGTQVTFTRSPSTGTLQAWALASSPAARIADRHLSIAFADGEATATADLAVPLNSIDADSSWTVTVQTRTQALSRSPFPGNYVVGTGDGLTRTVSISNVQRMNQQPTLAIVETDVSTQEPGGTNNTSGSSNQMANGSVTVTDPDSDDTTFAIQGAAGSTAPAADSGWTLGTGTDDAGAAAIAGTYGDLKLQADGTWTYQLAAAPTSGAAPSAQFIALGMLHEGTDGDGMEHFIFRADDGRTGDTNRYSAAQSFTIEVTGNDDNPKGPATSVQVATIAANEVHDFMASDFIPSFMDEDDPNSNRGTFWRIRLVANVDAEHGTLSATRNGNNRPLIFATNTNGSSFLIEDPDDPAIGIENLRYTPHATTSAPYDASFKVLFMNSNSDTPGAGTLTVSNQVTMQISVTDAAAGSAITISSFPSALLDNADLAVELTRTGGDTTGTLAVAYSYQVASGTAMNDTVTFAAGQTTADITIAAATLDADATETVSFTLLSATAAGALSPPLTVGAYTIPTDGSQSDSVVVTAPAGPNTAPTAPAIATQTATVNESFSYTIPAFTDAEGGSLTYSVTGLPTGLTHTAPAANAANGGSIAGTVTDIGTHSITVTAADDGTPSMSGTATFTLAVAAAPVPPSMAAPVSLPEPARDANDNPTTAGAAIEASDLGFTGDDDSRLTSVTFTLPARSVGVLYVDGQAVTTSNNEFTRQQLAAANLRFVPANRKAAGTLTVSFTTSGANGGAITAGMLSYAVAGTDDAPVAATRMVNDMSVTGVAAANATRGAPLGGATGLVIPTDAFDPVDADDPVDPTKTEAQQLDNQGMTSALPTWLTFTPGTAGGGNLGTLTGTPPVNSADMLNIRITVKDAADNEGSNDFTITIRDNTPPTARPVAQKVDDLDTLILATAAFGFTDADGNELAHVTIVSLPAEADGRLVNNGAGVAAGADIPKAALDAGSLVFHPVDKDAQYIASFTYRVNDGTDDSTLATMNITVEDTVITPEARQLVAMESLEGIARAMGWDLVDAISKRASLTRGGSKKVDMSPLTQRLTDRLTQQLGRPDTRPEANEILNIIATLNDRSVEAGNLATGHGAGFNPATGSVHGPGAGSPALGLGYAGNLATGSPALGQGYASRASAMGTLAGRGADMGVHGFLTQLGTDSLNSLYGAAEGGLGGFLPDGMAIWSGYSNSQLDFSQANGNSYDGDIASLQLGVETSISRNRVLGIVYSVSESDMDYIYQGGTNQKLFNGRVESRSQNINPYIIWVNTKGMAWATLGLGRGDFDYEEMTPGRDKVGTDTADLEMSMLALGGEYKMLELGIMEVLGRGEIMATRLKVKSKGNQLLEEQDVNVSGMRGEFELGWPMATEGDGKIRPYLMAGIRQDKGDLVAEYGAGLSVLMNDFSIDSEFRTQDSAELGEFERTSYTLSFSYDSGNDGQGMMLELSQDYGVNALDAFASFNAGGNASLLDSQGSGKDLLSLDLGYGLALNRSRVANAGQPELGLLTFRASSSFSQGRVSQTNLGLLLEPAASQTFGTYELLLSRKHGAFESMDSFLLKLTREF